MALPLIDLLPEAGDSRHPDGHRRSPSAFKARSRAFVPRSSLVIMLWKDDPPVEMQK